MRSLIIDLMRHGEPAQRGLYLGRTDLPLSDEGQDLARQVLASSPGWQRIYSSPLKRCYQSAEEAGQQLQLEVIADKRLQEYDFGDWDGLPTAQVYQQQESAVAAFWQDPLRHPPPGAESLEAFSERIQDFVRECLSREEQHILWLCHGGVIRALIAHCLGVEAANWQKISIDYCSLSRIRLFPGEGQYWSQLEYVNLRQF